MLPDQGEGTEAVGPRTREESWDLHKAQASPCQLPRPCGTHSCPRGPAVQQDTAQTPTPQGSGAQTGSPATPTGSWGSPSKAGKAPRPVWAAQGQLGTAPLTRTLTAALSARRAPGACLPLLAAQACPYVTWNGRPHTEP